MGGYQPPEDRRYVYAVRKNAGICVVCGIRPAEPGKRSCYRCLKKRSNWTRARDYKRLSKGLCVICGKNPFEPGITFCKQCLEHRTARRKALHDARIDAGKCPVCGRDRGIDTLYCWRCLRKLHNSRADGSRKNKDHQRYEQRKKYGLCPRCGKPVDDIKYVYCSKCRWQKQIYNRNCVRNKEESNGKKAEKKPGGELPGVRNALPSREDGSALQENA